MKSTPIVTSLALMSFAFAGTFQAAEAQDHSDLLGGWIVTS